MNFHEIITLIEQHNLLQQLYYLIGIASAFVAALVAVLVNSRRILDWWVETHGQIRAQKTAKFTVDLGGNQLISRELADGKLRICALMMREGTKEEIRTYEDKTKTSNLDGLIPDFNRRVELQRLSQSTEFAIRRKDLLEKGFKNGAPFKFYCEVRNNVEVKAAVFAALCSHGMVVTGEGSPRQDLDQLDDSFWWIWFLHPSDALYRKRQFTSCINNAFSSKVTAI